MGSRCKRLRSANFILLQPFDGLCCTVSLYPFQSGTDIRETECHPTQKRRDFCTKAIVCCLWNLPTKLKEWCIVDAKHFFFFQLDNFYETTIIVATGMIKRTDLENCRDKSDVIYGNWWLYDQSPNLTASCPVLKPMKKFPLFFLIEKVVGEEELKQLDEKYVPSYFFSLVGSGKCRRIISDSHFSWKNTFLGNRIAKRCDHQMMQFSSYYLTS